MAGELWLLLIQVFGKVKRAKEFISEDLGSRTIKVEDMDTVGDFVESGKRVIKRLKRLLRKCEEPMLQECDQKTGRLGKASGKAFVKALFGREQELRNTEAFMQGMRLWNLRWDVNVEHILKSSHQSQDNSVLDN
ncbi:hypothetical protein N8I77_003358 [Diaporthe amygdali]|uniref:Uncharacterized protein n=1 Tax=Phomopsis amygdali TaxID=1214568 RepID=A0AAD9SHT8_PHOAM|nr:hypothetical protein N8I77_003358 [Diaporthe amygdali]